MWKVILGIFLPNLVILLIISAIYYVNSPDDMSKAQTLFDSYETIPLTENGDVYLKGFGVPENVKLTEYGYNLYKKYQDYTPALKTDIIDNDNYLKDPNDILVFKGQSDALECWFDQSKTIYTLCLTPKELEKTVKENQVLLNRLEELWQYNKFSEDLTFFTYDYFNVDDFVHLQNLFHANLVRMSSNGRNEQAIYLWIRNITLLNNLMSSRYDYIIKANIMFALEHAKETLLKIIDFKKIDDITYQKIKAAILRPAFGPEGFDLIKTSQADYNFALKPMILGLQNETGIEKIIFTPLIAPKFSRYEYAEFSYKLISLAKLSGKEFILEHEKISTHYEYAYPMDSLINSIKLFTFAAVPKLLLNGMYKVHELVYRRYIASIEDRMIILALEIKRQNIPKDKINKFLKNQPEEFQNPISKRPFNWNNTEIYFINPEDNRHTYNIKI